MVAKNFFLLHILLCILFFHLVFILRVTISKRCWNILNLCKINVIVKKKMKIFFNPFRRNLMIEISNVLECDKIYKLIY